MTPEQHGIERADHQQARQGYFFQEGSRCPHCDARLSSEERANGWCDWCGRRVAAHSHHEEVDVAHRSGGQQGSGGILDALDMRLAGLLILALGAVLAWLCVYSPLCEAARNAASVSISLKGVIITPLVLALGLVYLVWGETARGVLSVNRKLTAGGWVFTLVMMGVGLLCYVALQTALEGYGYRF